VSANDADWLRAVADNREGRGDWYAEAATKFRRIADRLDEADRAEIRRATKLKYVLKPCPFCGCEAEVRELASFRWVECMECHAEMTSIFGSNDTPMERWNRRTK